MTADFRITMRTQCVCAEAGHDIDAFRTATAGLVVHLGLHGESASRWQITHWRTGLTLSHDYGDPETAMAAAASLDGAADWSALDPQRTRTVDRETLLATLGGFSGARAKGGGYGIIREVNA